MIKEDKVNQALYDLFEAVMDTAIDIYWGSNNHFTEEETEAFTEEEYAEAEKMACLEMVERVRYGNDFPYVYPDEKPEATDNRFDVCVRDLGDLYGKYLRLTQTRKSLTQSE